MSVPVLTFFNNKGGVGKTSLVYHVSWMLEGMGRTVVAVDLDAQANLTAAFLDEDRLESLWEENGGATTVYRALLPLTRVGDILPPRVESIADQLHLVPGDVALATFEDTLSDAWARSLGDDPYRHFRILSAFWQVAQMAAEEVGAELILVDVGPNLGAINRSAIIASDYVVIPLGADLFSLQGLKNLGPKLNEWRGGWRKRLDNWSASHAEPPLPLPEGGMAPLGYVVQQHGVRLSRPVKAYDRWVNRMPAVYHEAVLESTTTAAAPAQDPECLATLKHYRSLVPMGQEARKPIFRLTSADGAIGGHGQAVQDAYRDYRSLTETLLARMEAAERRRRASV